ncbi:hypothetical protein PV11_07374 [Exophiala sideris]|uniref:Mediator of RNA polymerase II transcription subunit 4 n=1 Tax=Exophiala sideris TaxID=1016849 RepID=A0A0D1YA18_9EURO|nr:hypothetical protein PV11_07374 [Exophiala sideris]
MESAVHDPLNSLESHLNALITSLTQTNTFANAPQFAKDLVADDDSLAAALNLLRRHQQNYATILSLRAEVAELQNELKDTVRRCVALRRDIVEVQPSILSADSDEENDEETRPSEIDYHTLLAFAARIGKHNATAAREAEAESVRRKVAAQRDKINGLGDSNAENATAETEAEVERINNTVAQTRAQMGMSFPDANVLRVGALGQLQLFRERQAQMAGADETIQAELDREVERLVRASEDVAEKDMEKAEEHTTEEGTWLSPEMSKRSLPGHEGGLGQSKQAASLQQSQSRPGVAAPAHAPKRKVGLDFPSSDEEDED